MRKKGANSEDKHAAKNAPIFNSKADADAPGLYDALWNEMKRRRDTLLSSPLWTKQGSRAGGATISTLYVDDQYPDIPYIRCEATLNCPVDVAARYICLEDHLWMWEWDPTCMQSTFAVPSALSKMHSEHEKLLFLRTRSFVHPLVYNRNFVYWHNSEWIEPGRRFFSSNTSDCDAARLATDPDQYRFLRGDVFYAFKEFTAIDATTCRYVAVMRTDTKGLLPWGIVTKATVKNLMDEVDIMIQKKCRWDYFEEEKTTGSNINAGRRRGSQAG